MNYYQQIYDVNFFARKSYTAEVRDSSIRIDEPGIPVWPSWQGQHLSSVGALDLWNKFQREGKLDTFSSGRHQSSDRQLLTLILCEDAYRRFDAERFFLLNRLLTTSADVVLRLKATKLRMAWNSLCRLTGRRHPVATGLPLEGAIGRAVDYLNTEASVTGRAYTAADVKVEAPVREDFVRLGVSVKNPQDMEKFYRTSFSYILELTAANYQVETLFNYSVVIDLLKKLGVQNVYDYGAGIGTFTALAQSQGIHSTHADVESKTADYAKFNLSRMGFRPTFAALDPDPEKVDLPQELDCIVCTELLEHIPHPAELINKFRRSLRKGGILVVSESFNYVDEFCTHLPQHKGTGDDVFLKFMGSNRFRQISTGYAIHPSVHLHL